MFKYLNILLFLISKSYALKSITIEHLCEYLKKGKLKTFYIKSNSPIVLSGITFEDLYKTGDYCYMVNGVNFSVKSKNSSKIKSDQIEIDTAYYETVSEADRSMDA